MGAGENTVLFLIRVVNLTASLLQWEPGGGGKSLVSPHGEISLHVTTTPPRNLAGSLESFTPLILSTFSLLLQLRAGSNY